MVEEVKNVAKGTFGKFGGVAVDGAFVAWDTYSAISQENKRRADLARQLSRSNLEIEAKNNSALKAELEALNEKTRDAIRKSVVGLGGAGVGAVAGAKIGGAIATFAIPVPIVGTITGATVGGIVGSVAGSFTATAADSAIFDKPSNSAFAIKASIEEDIKSGAGVSDVKTFAWLASGLPSDKLKFINDQVKKRSGGDVSTLEEAVSKGRADVLSQLANEPAIDELLGASLGLNPIPGMTTSAQIAQMLNNGMDPNVMMRSEWRVALIDKMNASQIGMMMQQGMDVSSPTGDPLPTMRHDGGREVPGGGHRKSGKPVRV
ncbi:MAG: hypothetical protein LW823_02285 [Rickettsiales bacterium]|jgi:hypothetical protein|nr:hypothetical protein [Rickettsiales bacterium]